MVIKFHILLCNICTVSPDRSERYYAYYDQQKPHFITHGITTRVLHLSSPLFLKLFIADTPRVDSHTDGTQRDVCMLSVL